MAFNKIFTVFFWGILSSYGLWVIFENGVDMGFFVSLWKRFVMFITFINLPIKKKFLLFGLGTFFWFLTITMVSVSVLTFVNYRFSQISHTIIPYMQTIKMIYPKTSQIDYLSHRARSDKYNDRYVFEISLHIKQIQDQISSVILDNQTKGDENFFEALTYTLSKNDPTSIKAVNDLYDAIKEIDIALADKEDINWVNIDKNIKKSKKILLGFSDRIDRQLKRYTEEMAQTIKYSINTIVIIFFIAVLLLWFFTRWLTEAFSKPIQSMIQQIHSIGTGEVDLNKKLKIKSKDEIGILSKEFNKLVDTVYGVTVFKKVIEEDSNLGAVYSRLADVFSNEAGISEFKIFSVDNAKQQMKIVQPPICSEEDMQCYPEILHDCSLCRAQKTGHKVSSFEFKGICSQFTHANNKEHICVPLMVTGKTGAVVQFLFDKTENDDELEKINEKFFKAESYIKNSLSVIETKQLMETLRESSLVDSLTGLYNRRFLQDYSTQIIAGVLRRKKQIGLIMCDMDFFKQVNDEHGHDIGDSVLRDTSKVLRESIRESDVVIRFGGEEFLVLLIDSDPDQGIQIAEKIRQNIEKTKFQSSKGGALKKTISMGISEFPSDTDGFWQAIKFADVALYKAKEEGRNRCIRFEKDMWEKKDDF